FAPEFLRHNLSEQHLLCSLPVLAHARVYDSKLDEQHLHDALRAIHDHLGYAFFESAIRACVGKAQVSQGATMRGCVRFVCNSFPNDILSLAQRYGDLIIRLHGAALFLNMLRTWCTYQAHQVNPSNPSLSQEALVEVFDSPLTRAAAMILYQPNLSPIDSPNAVVAAFDDLSLADRARLL
ncbi:MAG: hypothetical protein RMJ96_08825, partial [Candidatus Bipolaricaulota bacterium]|nr:hypothetical protein [Candidatus Bipolaricaulota bacterium]